MLLYTEKHVFFGVLEGAFLYQIVYTIASLMQIQICPIFSFQKLWIVQIKFVCLPTLYNWLHIFSLRCWKRVQIITFYFTVCTVCIGRYKPLSLFFQAFLPCAGIYSAFYSSTCDLIWGGRQKVVLIAIATSHNFYWNIFIPSTVCHCWLGVK